MKALKQAVRSTIVIAGIAAAHAAGASPVDASANVQAAGGPSVSAAIATETQVPLSDAARDRILSKSSDQVAMVARPKSWVQLGDPWMQWRGQVKRAIDDEGPSGDVFDAFGEANRVG